MANIIWIDPINRDPQFLQLISNTVKLYIDDIEVISTQRSGIKLNSDIPFKPFFQEIDTIDTGKISCKRKLMLIRKYFYGFQTVADNIKPGSIVFYCSRMNLPELERICIQKIKNKGSKIVLLIHNLKNNQSIFPWLSKLRNHYFLEVFDYWVFFSNYTREKALAQMNLSSEKTYTMLHPHFHPMLKDIKIDYKLITLLQRLAKGRLIIAYTSRVDQAHGIDLFYKLLYEIQRKGVAVYGVVLGRFAKEWNQAKNQKIIDSYGFTANELYTQFGTYTYSELLAVLAAADCVLAPYRYISQSGNIALVLGEGIPVIASNTGANNEMVIDGLNGILFNIENLNNLIDEIVTIYNRFGSMRQRFVPNLNFNSHLDPEMAVSNFLKWLDV